MNLQNSDASHRDFIAQYSVNHRRIYGFVVSISPTYVDADEIFQSISLVLWQKWPEYVEEGKFLCWALRIAKLEVVKQLSKQRRRREIFSDDVLELIQTSTSEHSSELDDRMLALQECLKRLPEEQRSLIRRCYSGTNKIKEIASSLGLDAQNLYIRLQRIRKTLHRCVDRSTSQL